MATIGSFITTNRGRAYLKRESDAIRFCSRAAQLGTSTRAAHSCFQASVVSERIKLQGRSRIQGGRVVMTGQASVIDDACRPFRKFTDTLVFDYLYNQ